MPEKPVRCSRFWENFKLYQKAIMRIEIFLLRLIARNYNQSHSIFIAPNVTIHKTCFLAKYSLNMDLDDKRNDNKEETGSGQVNGTQADIEGF
jgi:hypothetical protein